MSGKSCAIFEETVYFTDLQFCGLTKKFDGKELKGKNIKISLKSMNKLMFVDYKNEEHYGDAIYENFPRLYDVHGMSEAVTLDIKKNGKAAGTI